MDTKLGRPLDIQVGAPIWFEATVLTPNRHMAEVLAHLGRGVLFHVNTGL